MASGRNIKGITVEIDGNVTGLQKALESVNKTIKNTQSELKDVERLLKLDPSNTELLSQKQEKLKTAIQATKEKLDALKTAQEQAKQQMENGDLGKDKYDALQREIIATEEELKRLAKEAADANTALTKIGEAGKTMENVGNKLSSVGQKLTTHVTAPIVAIGTAAVKTTADFDSSMSQVSAVSGATGDEFDALRNKAREMGAKTKFSASEAADAMNYMAMAGWKTGDMLSGIEGIMNLAAASGEDLATTSDIVTDALTAFGLSASDSGHFADILAAASSNANTNVSMLGESFKYAAPVAGALGIAAEDTSIALGLMANAGIKASQGGTALRTGLTNLAKPTKQMQTYMDKYNISLVENSDGSINLRATMESLRQKMGGLSEAEQAAAASAIFGKNSMAGWLAIINASPEDFDKLTTAIDNCDGEAERMAATMQDNLNGQITILKSALEELAIQIGDALMPTIRDIVSKIQDFVLKLQQMDEGTRNTIIKIAAFAAAIGPVILVVGKLTTGIGKGLQAVSSLGKGILTLINQTQMGVGPIAKLTTAIGGISAPVVAVVAAIGVLVAAFIHLWNTNEEFREKVTAIWERVKSAFQGLADKISSLLGGIEINFSTITEALGKVWDAFCNLLAPVIEGALAVVVNTLETVLKVLTGLLDVFKGLFTGDWETLWSGVKQVFSSVWDGIRNYFSIVLDAIKGVVNTFLGWFGTNWQTVWDGVKTFFTNIWTGISTFFSTTWNGLKTTVTTAMSNISSGIQTGWNTAKTNVTTALTAISGTVSSVWNTVKSTVSSAVNSVKSTISSGFNSAKSTVSSVFESIKSKITSVMDSAKNAVQNAISNIKSKFNFSWSLPKLKMPHPKISGKFSLNPPSVPSFSIEWYRKAMNKGMILNSPTIFGAQGNRLLAGGESGSEAVVGTKSLMGMIQNAVSAMQGNNVNYGGVYITVNAAEGQDELAIARNVADIIQNQVGREAAVWA